MGIFDGFEAVNRLCGYTEENMIKQLDPILNKIHSTALCPIAVSIKIKNTLWSSKAVASGFATITDTNALLLQVSMPVKSTALYNYQSPRSLVIKDTIAGQKIIEGKLLNLVTMEHDDVILQVGYTVKAFPNQMTYLERFISYIEPYCTK